VSGHASQNAKKKKKKGGEGFDRLVAYHPLNKAYGA
jgi:hypothetical protein